MSCRCASPLMLLSMLFLSGCPELPAEGTKVLFVVDTCCDEISGAGGTVIAYRTRTEWKEHYLTHYREYSASPRWFSDGQRILYSREGKIMLMDHDGANKKVILDGTGVSLVRLSKDEQTIYFLRGSDVLSVGIDGTGEKLLAKDAYDTFLEIAGSSGRLVFSRMTHEKVPNSIPEKWVTRFYSLALDGSDEFEIGGDIANVTALGDISPDGKLAGGEFTYEDPEDPYPDHAGLIHLDNSAPPEPSTLFDKYSFPHFNSEGTLMVFAVSGAVKTCTPMLGDVKTVLLNYDANPTNAWFDPEDEERIWFAVESLPALGFTQYASGSASVRLDGTDLRREIVGIPDRAAVQP